MSLLPCLDSRHNPAANTLRSSVELVTKTKAAQSARPLKVDSIFLLLRLQLNLAHAHCVALYRTGHVHPDILGLFLVSDEFLGLLIAGRIEFHHFLVRRQDAVTALYAIRHLQAVFGVLGAEIRFATFFFRAGQVHQISLYGAVSSKGAD